MSDDGIRLRNVSHYGEIDVPELGLVLPHHHEVVVANEDLAKRLLEGGHFTQVGKPGPKSGEEPGASDEQTSTDESTDDKAEEPTSDHAA